MSENEYWTRVRGLVQSGHDARTPKRDVAASIIHIVEAAEAAGEAWAYATLTRWLEAGASADYTRVFKDMNTVTYIRRDGRRVRKTVAYSRPKRDGVDGEIVGRQMQAWWGMSLPAVMELRAELAEQQDRLGDVVTALDALINAMERHPECETALAAWQMDGHSPDEIDLADVA